MSVLSYTSLASHPDYVLGSSDEERQRLAVQGRTINKFTHRFLLESGIKAGFHVVDLGTGVGDVALIASQLVGPTGSVTAVDQDENTLRAACARLHSYGVRNVEFVKADVRHPKLSGPFDAVIGRYILMHQKDPLAVIKAAAAHLRPGGIAIFQEPDLTVPCRSYPHCELYTRAIEWSVAAMKASGVHIDMGLQLHKVFEQAGLKSPTLRADTVVRSASTIHGCELVQQTLRSLLPAIELHGIASHDELGLETLSARMSAEIKNKNATVVSYSLIGAAAQV